MKKKTKINNNKYVYIGTFFGFNLKVEIPEELKDIPEDWFKDKFSEWRIQERKNAIEEYKSELFLQDLKVRSRLMGFFKKR
jgi:hypothetical protein